MSEKVRKALLKEEDKQFIEQVYSDYEASKSKKPIDKWQKYDRYVEDDQYGTSSEKDEWKPKPQINICWAALRTIHANMTGGKTSINITCKRPLYDEITQGLNDVITSYWDELDMDLLISEGEWIRPKLGSVAIKSVWNPSKNDGKGDLDCEIVHPANVFIDPNITNPWHVQRADFIDFVKPVSMKYVLNKYSKESDSLCKFSKAELKEILIPETSTSDTEIYGDLTDQTSQNIPVRVQGTGSAESFNMRGIVNLHEYWYKDDEGKLQIGWLAGQVPLKKSEDDPEMKSNGFYKHGKYPLVYIPYIQKDKRLDGRSELQSLIGQSSKRDGIQDIVNILVQDYLVSEKLTGQPQKAHRHGSIKDPSKWTGEAGLNIPTKGNPAQDLHILQGNTLVENMTVVDGMLTHADRITGQWDITQGRNSPAIKTLGQTSLLMEQAMKPQNDKINTLNHGLKELIELWIDHLSEFVTEDREYTKEAQVRNPDGTTTTQTVPFMFNPSTMLKAPDMTMDPMGEVIQKVSETNEPLTRRLYFKINVDIGATLAMTKAYMMEIAFQLWQQKLIDIEGVYKLLPEFPGKQESLERMKAMMQQPTQEIPPEQDEQGIIPPEQIQEFISGLPEGLLQTLDSIPEGQREQVILDLMTMPPDQMEEYMNSLLGGEPNG